MIAEFTTGAGYLVRGFGLIRRPGLRRFVALPLAVNLAVFGSLLWLGGAWFQGLLESWLPDVAVLRYLFWVLFAAAGLLLAFYAFALLANFIAAPFNGLLAEQVERALTGNKPPSSGRVLAVLGTVLAAFLSELGKLLYLLAWTLPVLALILIPGLQLLAPLAWFALSAWLLALEYLDYPSANHGIAFRALRRRIGERRWVAFGFGAAVVTLTAVPLVNLFVMPAAVAGATALWVEQYAGRRSA